jgi:DNA-binding response OmpR family regulator
VTQSTVLVVEDHQDLRTLMRLTLATGEYRVLEATDGETALDLVRAESPALVLLDVMLPGELTGLDVCRAIKADPESRPIPVVLLSARTQESDIEAGREAGADEYVKKPFSPARLLEVVEAELAEAAAAAD